MHTPVLDYRDASQLAYEEFIEKYALSGRPVILKGGVSQCFEPGRAWSRDFLGREAGHKVRYAFSAKAQGVLSYGLKRCNPVVTLRCFGSDFYIEICMKTSTATVVHVNFCWVGSSFFATMKSFFDNTFLTGVPYGAFMFLGICPFFSRW